MKPYQSLMKRRENIEPIVILALSAAGQEEVFQRDAKALYSICLAKDSITLYFFRSSQHDPLPSSDSEPRRVILPRLSGCLKVPIYDPDRLRR